MKIINDITSFSCSDQTAIAIGTFDGVHKGHQQVITATNINENIVPAVFTFEQSPSGFIDGKLVSSLSTQTVKYQLIESLNVKLYISPDFQSIRNLSPDKFVKMLKTKLNAAHICCGFNFRFGKNSEGNASMLKQLCDEYNIQVSIIPPVVDDDMPISSTRIRELIAGGKVKKANDLLGHPFCFDFKVIKGAQLGRNLGFPTINQLWPNNFIIPKLGVYATRVKIGDIWYKSISNIGKKPTVSNGGIQCETYIMDFNGDLYGSNPFIEVFDFIREERLFKNIDELRQAIFNDVELVKGMDYQ